MDQSHYPQAKTRIAEGTNGVSYAYRRVGPQGGRPLVLLQHFRGNLETWDPDLINALSAARDVIVSDNTGVGATTGTTPTTVAQMADDAIVFIEALGLSSVDLLGYVEHAVMKLPVARITRALNDAAIPCPSAADAP